MFKRIITSIIILFFLMAVFIFIKGKNGYALKTLPPNNLPTLRSFTMGFAYQPHDWSEDAFAEMSAFMSENGDMVNLYFSDGVPWPEAYEGKPFHPNFENEINKRLRGIKPDQKIVLTVSMLAQNRRDLGEYVGESDWAPRESMWKDKTFNDPEVIEAYLNYCRRMIDRIKPDYFIYGAEVDSAFTDVNDPDFKNLLVLVKEVYSTLKTEYPLLSLSMEFVLGDEKYNQERLEVTQTLLKYSDLYPISTYPCFFDGIGGDVSNLPADWFSKVRSIAGSKPLAVVETGWMAENFDHPDHGVLVFGRADWQARYLQILLEESQKLDAEFVSWWVYRDYDKLWKIMEQNNTDPMLKQWMNMGLLDGGGNRRPSMDVWDAWLAVPVE